MHPLTTKSSLLVLALGSVINTLGLLYSQHHGLKHFVENKCSNPRDVGFASLKHNATMKYLIDGPLILVLPMVSALTSPRRVEIFREFALLFGIILIIRGISISLTQLPHTREVDTSRSLLKSCVFGADYDKIFSGHTAFMVVTTMILVQYGVWHPIMYVLPLAMGYLLIETRSHYTVDVFLGGVIALLVVLVFKQNVA